LPQALGSKHVSFRNVLLATDFKPSAHAALLHALGLARRYGARVFMVHVVNPAGQRLLGQEAVERATTDAWRQAQTTMTNLLIEGRLEGIEYETLVKTGDVWQELSKVITEFDIDLLVTGTRGRSGVWKMLLGSTAEVVFRQAPCPVLTVGPRLTSPVPSPEGPKRILYCTGFAPHSLAAGEFAVSLAEQQGATLALLHVVSGAATESAQTQEEIRAQAQESLKALIPTEGLSSNEPEVFVGSGDVPTVIVETAERWNADLIVLGLRRADQDPRGTRWSTAYSVVSNAPCPVLTIRTPE